MERFKIFPSIGIARLGGSINNFYLCPDKEGSLGIEINSNGNETELQNFKDSSGLIKRQGARFQIFELDPTSQKYSPFISDSATIEWTVNLVNKKAAVDRSLNTPSNEPPINAPNLPLPLRQNADELIINGGVRRIEGKNKSGVNFDSGKFKNKQIFLGELKTDKNGNLIVLGGHGKSESVQAAGEPPTPIRAFYFTKNWHDDTSDSYVKATIKLQDGTFIDALGAWVIVAPPDFAPLVKGVVTLYDVMEQVAIDQGRLKEVVKPSFRLHILPLINRFKNLKWVHGGFDTEGSIFNRIKDNDSVLSDNSASNKGKREFAKATIKLIKGELLSRQDEEGNTGYELCQSQINILDKWGNGDFINDFPSPVSSPLSEADKLNKIILDTTVGQGFYPGIEGGIIVKNPSIYIEPFRFDTNKPDFSSGDVTALMALPWQADFLQCVGEWWPSQRPDNVKLENGKSERWDAPLDPGKDFEKLVQEFNRLGFVKPTLNSQEQIEDERDPNFSRI